VRRRSSFAALTGALVLSIGLTSAPAVAETSAKDEKSSIKPAGPLLDRPQKGAKALTALGDDLAVAADRNDLGTSELRALLRSDDTVWVDKAGMVFFIDPVPTAEPADETKPEKAAPLADTFTLHSNPGANLTILLDFDGSSVSDTAWNASYGVSPGTHPAWDPAGNGPSFSDSERLQVQQVWAMVAEDYAPFNVDITTEDTGADQINRSSSADTVYGTRVLVTPSSDPFVKICSSACGGVAYLNVFASVGDYQQPAWVFPQALGNNAKYVAEAASHEAGHNLGLQHDGTSTADYYTGHGIWAPIMGAGYDKPLVQWSAGSYSGANNQQDDMSVLTGYLGARADEASGSVAAPSQLPTGEAVIGSQSDVDAYLLGGCSAGSTVSIAPASVAPNLDVRAVLYDANGVEIAASQPESSFGDGTTAGGLAASLTVSGATTGSVLTVEGVGQGAWAAAGYDDYGSLGAYTVSAPGCDGALADGVPTEPVDVATGPVAQDSLAISWSAPLSATGGPVTGYVVTRSGSTATQTLPADARSHTFSGLTAGTTYELSVRAVNTVGAGRSVTISATTAPPTPTVPSAPRDVTGTYNQSLKQIEAYWVEPATTGSQPISGYAIYLDRSYLGQLGSTSRGVVVSNPNGFSAGNHSVEIAAVNAVGESSRASVTINVVLPTRPANDDVANATRLTGTGGLVIGEDNTYATKEATDPSPPTSYGTGGYSVWYSWTPTSSGSAQMRTYGGSSNRDTTLAVYTGQPGSLVQLAGNDDTYGFHAAVSFNAVAGTRYLMAVDGFSTAGGTGPFDINWDQTVPTVPNAPGGVSASRGDSSATVAWTAPSSNGSPITGYVIEGSPGNITKTVGVGVTSSTVTSLTNGTAYSFTVKAVNAVGTSPASAASNTVTPAGAPDKPAKPSVARGDKSATVSWEKVSSNGSPVTGYVIEGAPGSSSKTVDADTVSTTIGGLTNGTAYSFTVKAINAVGTSQVSDSSSEVTPAGVPDKPAKPSVVRGDKSVTVSWEKVSGNGSEVTGYVIEGAPGSSSKTVDADTVSTTIGGLTNGTAYSFTVKAINAIGTSAASEPSSAVVPAGLPFTATLNATRGDKSATLTWAPPASNGSTITEYRISDGTRVLTAPGTATSLKVTGLTNGRTYNLTLTAVNAVGEGAPSTQVVVTPAGRPSAPTRPSATAGNRYAKITWRAPSGNGSAITSYQVRRSDGTVRTVRGAVLSYKWSSLKKGKKYSFKVYAVNRVGTSSASSSSSTVKIK
jgi:hypothetical protein